MYAYRHTLRASYMDPLSITSGVIAVLTASGNAIQGLQKISELRHREKEFSRLRQSVNGIRALIFSIEISLKDIQKNEIETERFQDCIGMVSISCGHAIDIFAEFNDLLREVQSSKKKLQPSKVKWLLRKSRLMDLLDQITGAVDSVATALITLQGLQIAAMTRSTSNGVNTLLSKLDPVGVSSSLVSQNHPYLITDAESVTSSQDSFQSAVSTSHESTASPSDNPHTSLQHSSQCENSCQCQCHTISRFRSPLWTRHILGSLSLYGNSSIWLKRKVCDKRCNQSGSTRLQILYQGPSWALLKGLVVYANAQLTGGGIPTFHLVLPRIIPSDAIVWSVIELGNKAELQRLLSHGKASPYDINSDGTSLLKYALKKGQSEIGILLLQANADPFMRDKDGIMTVQPEIDHALTEHHNLERYYACATRLLLTEEAFEQQCFSLIHRIVLRLSHLDFSDVLMFLPDVNSIDANGRTALHWAAWRGDTYIVRVLVDHHAKVDKTDHENYTPLSRAAQAGHIDSVKVLLQAGASLEIPTTWGHQAIHLASRNRLNGHRIVRELLTAGADPNAYSHGSGTPLHNAAICGSIDTVDLLLDSGADINAIDKDGDSPAMVALYCWSEDIFLRLVKFGAQLDITNGRGHNIMQLAVWTASTTTWDLLAELAQGDDLGFIDTSVLHGDHGIWYCFDRCRSLWFVGEREAESEKTSLTRLVEKLSIRH
ncbi:unnamed protein product [Periconia digitata]|uniref:Ankyrin repeat protein n=1 Tax=Periconia digitata TaxID=1303443 RepID=A0A9W4XR13_9PLEO|nr:unnamed protein product [Periconia digitata]